MMNFELFDQSEPPDTFCQILASGAVILRHFALHQAEQILSEVSRVSEQMPFRHMITPGGYEMSVAMTNCGRFGWVTDRSGYRYSELDPLSGKAWISMPPICYQLAVEAASQAGFNDFQPDACLINRYDIGAKMSLHQDKDEPDLNHPIVSMSFGLPAKFQFGGLSRSDKTQNVMLTHGDVVVWGGESRLAYHGILPIRKGYHPATGEHRINLTFRQIK
ncbi:alpha-ketoglutarate-dependent dioxygenase AlkB [Pragia fontium]|uniref:Alpha-ketoglutarate-dependent dioxygenase AlkB n=2 Tax=Pragia fontium TaxID=82985 RepID=A0ABQ5LEU8_9GAMM|nr:alpha-ketoglutarate-dependent dioxygenase AlkB [Pragia fontium]